MSEVAITTMKAPSPGSQTLNIVECRGLGHPDTICDALAEALSQTAPGTNGDCGGQRHLQRRGLRPPGRFGTGCAESRRTSEFDIDQGSLYLTGTGTSAEAEEACCHIVSSIGSPVYQPRVADLQIKQHFFCNFGYPRLCFLR